MQKGWGAQTTSALFALAMACTCLCCVAEQRNRTQVRITDISFRTVRTPKFRDTSNTEANAQSMWLQAYVEYETSGAKGGWTDELSLNWTVLARPGNTQPAIMHQTVSYVDVEDGKHHAVVYVRPGFVRRLTGKKDPNRNDFAVYVEIVVNGESLASREYSRNRQPRNWWRAQEPDVRTVDNELLARTDTPFAHMDYDFYEHIKPNKRQ